MGEFPSGQRGQTVNLLRFASMVRIRPPPPQKVQHLSVLDFLSCWRRIRRSKSQHASGMLLPPVQKLVATIRCTHRVHRQRIRPPLFRLPHSLNHQFYSRLTMPCQHNDIPIDTGFLFQRLCLTNEISVL